MKIKITGTNDQPTVAVTNIASTENGLGDGTAPLESVFELEASDPDFGETSNLSVTYHDLTATLTLQHEAGSDEDGTTSTVVELPVEMLVNAGLMGLDANGDLQLDQTFAEVLQEVLVSGDSLEITGSVSVTDPSGATNDTSEPALIDVTILGSDAGAATDTAFDPTDNVWVEVGTPGSGDVVANFEYSAL